LLAQINSTIKANRITTYLVFLLWPFLSLILAIFNFRYGYAKNIVWLFCAFFGYTFIVSNEEMDAARYRDNLIQLHERRLEPFDEIFFGYYDKGIYSATEVYGQFLTLAVSRFTNDFRIFYCIIGLVFGYFFSRNIFFVLQHFQRKKLAIITITLLTAFVFIVPFWSINGYRFYTATHIFVFAVLHILTFKKYRYLFIAFLAPLTHFSFVLPLVCLLIFLFFQQFTWVYVSLLVVSIFFANLDPKVINDNAGLAPEFMQAKVTGYTAKRFVNNAQANISGSNWYVMGHLYALYSSMYLLIGYMIVKRKKYLSNSRLKSLFNFGVFLFAIANFVSSVPSMERFMAVAALVLLASFLSLIQGYKDYDLQLNRLIYLVAPLLFLFIVVEVRVGMDFVGLNTLLLNPMTAPFFPDSPVLIEFIK
jgi:hypothetical protein